MITCTVHEAPDSSADRLERAERLAVVKDGFSWPALLLGPFWLLWNRLWLAFFAYAGLAAVLSLAWKVARLDPAAMSWFVLGSHVLLGLEASTLRRWTLDRQGWRLVACVNGASREECERRFFDAWLGEDVVARVAAGLPIAAPAAPVAAAAPGSATLAAPGSAGRSWQRLWPRRR